MTNELSLFVYDGKAEIDLPPDEICFSFTNTSSAGIFPLKGSRWRIDGTLPEEISEIGINYRNSPLSSDNSRGIFRFHAPRPGDRLPYFLFNPGENEMNIQDMVNSSFFHLFVFSRKSIPVEFMRYTLKYAGWLSVHFIPFDQGTRPLYQRLGIGKAGCYLVRPDMYIAYRSKKLIINDVEKYLKKLSIVTPEKIRGND